jgi:hypothetical protein
MDYIVKGIWPYFGSRGSAMKCYVSKNHTKKYYELYQGNKKYDNEEGWYFKALHP